MAVHGFIRRRRLARCFTGWVRLLVCELPDRWECDRIDGCATLDRALPSTRKNSKGHKLIYTFVQAGVRVAFDMGNETKI